MIKNVKFDYIFNLMFLFLQKNAIIGNERNNGSYEFGTKNIKNNGK